MHAHTGVFGPAVRTNASRLGREVRNGGYPVWAVGAKTVPLIKDRVVFDDYAREAGERF